MIYFDSSALVKRYPEEAGTVDVTSVASDSNLLKAAGAEKLQVMNPLDEAK